MTTYPRNLRVELMIPESDDATDVAQYSETDGRARGLPAWSN